MNTNHLAQRDSLTDMAMLAAMQMPAKGEFVLTHKYVDINDGVTSLEVFGEKNDGCTDITEIRINGANVYHVLKAEILRDIQVAVEADDETSAGEEVERAATSKAQERADSRDWERDAINQENRSIRA